LDVAIVLNSFLKRALSAEFLRFVLVGTIGFVIDGGLMSLVIFIGGSYFYARVFSFPAAVLVTWQLNRWWTFAKSDKSRPSRQLRRYFTLQVVGALANFIVFIAILEIIDPTALHIFIAFAMGSAVGLAINYLGSKLIIYES
jgi:putative flippase GtrA